MKRFRNIRSQHLEGLSWRFWFVENMTFMNGEIIGMFSDYWYAPPNIFKEWKEWLWLFSLPFFYLAGIFIGPRLRKSEAFEYAKDDYEVTFYNKKNIDYITVVHALTGGGDGY